MGGRTEMNHYEESILSNDSTIGENTTQRCEVSIIMPIYNAAQYISEAIESIQKQTFENWELIIINEPTTTDRSEEIIKWYSYTDNRIKYYVNPAKFGISKSINEGISRAIGKYIVRMDADDLMYPNRLEEQITFMENNPDVGISGCDFDVLGENWRSNLVYDSDDICADLLFFVPLRHPTFIMRKDLLDEHNLKYDDNALAAEDYELLSRAAHCFRLANCNKKLLAYRRHENATVYRMLDEGFRVNLEIGRRQLNELGLYFNDDELELLYSHCLLNNQRHYSIENYIRLEEMLLDIWYSNQEKQLYNPSSLFKTLSQRWNKDKNNISCLNGGNNLLENAVFDLALNEDKHNLVNASAVSDNGITVLVNTENAESHIVKCLKSLINQDYSNYKAYIWGIANSDYIEKKIGVYSTIIAKIERTNTDDIREFAIATDSKYINIISGNHYLFKNYFSSAIDLLETQIPDVLVTNVRNSSNGISMEQIRVSMLWENCIDTAGIIFKKNLLTDKVSIDAVNDYYSLNGYLVDQNSLFINKQFCEFAYSKKAFISTQISKRLLENKLRLTGLDNLILTHEEYLESRSPQKSKKFFLKSMKKILEKNKNLAVFNQEILAQSVYYHWQCIFGENVPQELVEYNNALGFRLHNRIIIKFNRFFYQHSKYYYYDQMITRIIDALPKQEGSLYYPSCKDDEMIKKWTWERYQRLQKDLSATGRKIETKINQKVWDAEKRIIAIDDYAINLAYEKNKATYRPGEKIRVVIIFQVASFWASIDYLYREMLADNDFEVSVICYDEDYDQSIKTETARSFLEENNIPYLNWISTHLDDIQPHIVILQSPYDGNRRTEFKSSYLKSKGYRVIYVPYGMEIGDTEHSRKQQLDHIVRRYAWKIYTFSEIMHEDYRLYSELPDNVVVTGLPKFDALYHKEQFPISDNLKELAYGKKIVLWKVHFPKVAMVNGKLELFTPDIIEYIRFAKSIQNDKQNFYVFMPHPRFLEFNEDPEVQKQLYELMSILENCQNVFIDRNDDYRFGLLNANAIIIDRSSVAVEAGAVGVPVLFMQNDKFIEPMTRALTPLFNSYYQGSTSEDMNDFISMINKNIDTKREARLSAFQMCIPYYDGKCSSRIINNIKESLIKEGI